MIVVSDTSPISSLYLIGRLDLLPAIFGKIIIPEMVWSELLVLESNFGYDLSVFKTATWLEIRPVGSMEELLTKARFRIHEQLIAAVLKRVGEQ